MRIRIRFLVALAAGAFAFASTPAHAAFPYRYDPGSPPDDLTDKRVWMYAATPDRSPDPLVQANNADRRELGGVRGASLVDADASADQAWTTTTGRPDVTIAVLDSGIEFSDDGAMRDLRAKVRLNRAELPAPSADRTAPAEPGADCGAYRQRDGDDLDGNGVVNVLDWACDARVRPDPPRGVNDDVLEPQDLLIAFADGADDDGNGFTDDIAGWDFLDDDNDAYDDVQYGHGTGEARDSSGEADNGGDLGACPNCTFVPLRVGTSFIADVNRFALAVTYAVDNGVLVVQEALGTLNKSRLGGDAVEYAYRHGVAIIASAADEAAQHHNWPSSYPRVIVVNSVTRYDETFTPGSRSYLQLNGCTNFSSRITLAVPSVSCSSDATGRGAGMAGLVYSAALDAIERGELDAHPACTRSGGGACPISANEVRQLLIGGADDVNFARDPATGTSTEVTCVPLPTPACTDPFLAAPTTRLQGAPLATRSYPARRGHDQFYGYGRVNMARTVGAVTRMPPEVELESPGWYDMVDPAAGTAPVRGEVWARGRPYRCRVLVAPGSYPSDAGPEAAPPGDFTEVPSPVCDGSERTAPLGGELARIDLDALKARFPANTEGFDGREPGSGEQTASGRPNTEPTAFVVKVVATADGETGQDRRQAYLHRDRDLLPGFPRQLDGDGEASPALADLDGDNRSELIVANSDGVVHALRPDGSDAPGFPVHTDELPMQAGRAFGAGGVRRGHGAILASPAVGDLDRDGVPEIVAADLEGRVYVWGADGARIRTLRSNPDYSGRPLEPFANVRDGHLNRTQLGFLGSPVLADLDRDGRQEIVAAAMDRHVYAWDAAGEAVPGFPVLVVDRDKVASVDPRTHRVAFDRAKVPGNLDQGAIVSTPAVGDLTGDGRPEIVVGTNESYAVNQGSEGPLNAAGVQAASYQALGAALSVANGRLFALSPDGDPDGELMAGPAPWLEGWPFKVGILQAGVLPLVGEGVTGSPVIGEAPCGGAGPRVGTLPAAGAAYLVKPDGESCLGREGGRDVALASDTGSGAGDRPLIPAFGHPAFGALAGGTAFLAPAAGLQRALDVALPEYQGGQDVLAAWDPATGGFRPGWPRPVNDLQFLTGPSVADIDPASPGEEIVSGTASDDLQGFTGAGTNISRAWPKLTGDWTVANPAIGAFGARETDPGARKAVIALTRSGRILAYRTGGPACAPASWPRFHHDNANSGDARRDAVAPGRPEAARVTARRLAFTAPGDDLLCGRAARYEVRTADAPITAATFADAQTVEAVGAPGPAGGLDTLELRGRLGSHLAVRAVDEQGNPGRAATLAR